MDQDVKNYTMGNRFMALCSLLTTVWLGWRYRANVSVTIDMDDRMAISDHDCTGKPYLVQLYLVRAIEDDDGEGDDHGQG